MNEFVTGEHVVYLKKDLGLIVILSDFERTECFYYNHGGDKIDLSYLTSDLITFNEYVILQKRNLSIEKILK